MSQRFWGNTVCTGRQHSSVHIPKVAQSILICATNIYVRQFYFHIDWLTLCTILCACLCELTKGKKSDSEPWNLSKIHETDRTNAIHACWNVFFSFCSPILPFPFKIKHLLLCIYTFKKMCWALEFDMRRLYAVWLFSLRWRAKVEMNCQFSPQFPILSRADAAITQNC